MNKIRNKIIYSLVLLLSFVPTLKVNAITVNKGSWVYFSDYGLKTSDDHKRTSYKTSDGEDVYCIQFKKEFKEGTYTNQNCKTNHITESKSGKQYLTEKNYIVAGEIVSIINNKDWSKNKKYAYKVATLNEYLRKFEKIGDGAARFDNSTIADIISKAKTNATYYGTNKTKNLTKPSITGQNDNKIMTRIGTNSDGTFNYRKLMTFKNLNKTFNGTTPKYTVTASKKEGSGTIYWCTGTNKSTCQQTSSIEISGVETKQYYLRVENGTEATRITVKITGTASSKYSSASIYCRGTSNQAVLKPTSKTQQYSNYASVTFEAPDYTNHRISINKVDEYGESISGSKFKLYIKGQENNPLTLTTEDNGTRFVYKETIKAENDTFFNKTYCYEETKTPNGYRKGSSYCTEELKSTGNKPICQSNETGETVDDAYCDNSIENICKITKIVTTTTTSPEGSPTSSTETTTEYKSMTDGCIAPENTEENGVKTEYTAAPQCAKKNNSNGYDELGNEFCSNKDNYTKIEIAEGNISLSVTNQKNNIKISKKDATGSNEVAGAHLKICTETTYKEKGKDCNAAKTIDGTELSWTSSNSEAEFYGLPIGNYYIIEELPPLGHKLTNTTTQFSIDETGKVKSGKTEVKDNLIVINNKLNDITISKTDIVTSKELPGAKLSICTTVTSDILPSENESTEGTTNGNNTTNTKENYKLNLDMNGDCIPVILADGTEATWTSTKDPKVIKGLPAGTYYLVEVIAPKGYSTASSILFTMTEDGRILDKNGTQITDKKIVMKDMQIFEVKTGDLPIISIIVIALTGITTAIICYYHSTKKYDYV